MDANELIPAPSGRVPVKRQQKLADYRAEISASQHQMEEKKYHEKWRRFIQMYEANLNYSTDPAVDSIDVPIAFANVNILRSALTVNHPKFTASPRNLQSHLAATLCEEIVNWEWYHNDIQDEIRRTTDDLLITGNGFIKVGYQLDTYGKRSDVGQLASPAPMGGIDYAAFEQPGYNKEFDKTVEGAAQVLNSRAAMGSDLPSRSAMAKQLREQGSIIVKDDCVVERVSVFDMLVDSTATSMKNLQWIAQRVPVRSDVAQNTKNWAPRIRKQLRAGQKSIAEDPEDEGFNARYNSPNSSISQGRPGGEKIEWVIVWEFYDLQEGTMCVFDDNMADDFLVEPQPMPFKFGHPFIHIGNYSVPDKFWHIGDLERIETLQMEINKTHSALVNDRKGFQRKWMVREDYLTDAGPNSLSEVLRSEDDNLIASIPIKGQGVRMEDIISRVPSPALDPALYSVGSKLQNLMNEVSGISDFQRGASGGGGTATEAAIINDGTLARMKEKQGKLEHLMRDVARRLVQLKMQYMKSEKMLRISLGANPQSAEKLRNAGVDLKGANSQDPTELFTSYTAKDIQGEYDVIVEAGSSTAFNESQRRRSIQEMLATVGPFLQMGKIDVDALLTYVLRFGFGIPNASEFMVGTAPEPAGPQGGMVEPGAGPGGGLPPDLMAMMQGQGGPAGVPSVAGGVLQPSGGVPQSAAQPPPY